MRKNVMKFLFWNVKGKISNVRLLLRYAHENNVDIVALCEAPRNVLDCDLYDFCYVEHIDRFTNIDIQVFSRGKITAKYDREAKRFCILSLLSGTGNINLAVVHFNSLLYSDSRQLHQSDVRFLKECMANIEQKRGKNSLVVGDFNENLFGESIVDFNGFNARFFKFLVSEQTKRRHEQEEDLYYNPMLNVYNDNIHADKAKGTYFYKDNIGWYCFDQLLLKYPLAENFDVNKLRIVDKFDFVPLVKHNTPHEGYSDHLPIAFEINL